MPKLDPQTLELFLFFVVPGFVALKTYELVMPSENERLGDSLISLVAYSMVNLALMSPVMLLLSGAWHDHPVRYYLGILAAVVVAPAALALGWWWLHGYLAGRGWVLDPMPTAWDYFFSRKKTRWALIHLKSGEKFGGFFGRRSHASAFPTPESLYLEEVWRVNDEGQFVERVPGSAGLIVSHAECSLIEFFATEENNHDD